VCLEYVQPSFAGLSDNRRVEINRLFHSLAFTKQLWVIHLEKLIHRCLIELPPSLTLRDLPTDGLVSLVRRTVLGPATWAPGCSPKVSSEITLKLQPAPIYGLRGIYRPRLLPGGRHIIFPRRTGIEIWDIAALRLLWSRPIVLVESFEAATGPSSIILVLLWYNKCVGIK
jgi:hypothetical protein